MITVGDVATETLLERNVVPSLVIIDGKVGRMPYEEARRLLTTFIYRYMKVKSGPGFIAKDAILLIRRWARHPRKQCAIEVDGEEDLLTLPAITEAPHGSVIYYGQPGKGLVEIEVTKDIQQQVKKLLRQFPVKFSPLLEGRRYLH